MCSKWFKGTAQGFTLKYRNITCIDGETDPALSLKMNIGKQRSNFKTLKFPILQSVHSKTQITDIFKHFNPRKEKLWGNLKNWKFLKNTRLELNAKTFLPPRGWWARQFSFRRPGFFRRSCSTPASSSSSISKITNVHTML